jgi:hypothetical protein
MIDPIVKEIFILGLTHSGRTFRPSDWAERLAGVMSPFRPGGAQNRFHPASYSPWCLPTTLNGAKCVVVHTDLRNAEPMAYDFVMNFARDNDLQTVQACLLPTEIESGAEVRDSNRVPPQVQSQAQVPGDLQLQAS